MAGVRIIKRLLTRAEVNDGGIGGVGCYQIMWSGVLKRICYGILKISFLFLRIIF